MKTKKELADEAEKKALETLKEFIWNDPSIRTYIRTKIKSYDLSYDIDGPLSEDKTEIVCQYQNCIMQRLLGRVITNSW